MPRDGPFSPALSGSAVSTTNSWGRPDAPPQSHSAAPTVRRVLGLEGPDGLEDRTSAPRRCPHRLSAEVIDSIVVARLETLHGPDRLACRMGRPRSTIYGVLRRARQSLRFNWTLLDEFAYKEPSAASPHSSGWSMTPTGITPRGVVQEIDRTSRNKIRGWTLRPCI